MKPHWYEHFLGYHAQQHKYCKVCHKENVPLFACGSCVDTTSYCGKECQAKDVEHIGLHVDKKMRIEAEPEGMIAEIPKDVLKYMTRYLAKEDLLNFSLVSKWMYDNLKEVYIQQSMWTINDPEHFVAPKSDRWRNIRHLRIIQDDEDEPVENLSLIPIYEAFPNVTHLELYVLDGDITETSRLQKLVSLTLKAWLMEEVHSDKIMFLLDLPNLVHLKIDDKYDIYGDSKSPSKIFFTDILAKLTQLETFELNVDDMFEFKDEELVGILMQTLLHLPKLKSLSVPFLAGNWDKLLPLKNLRTFKIREIRYEVPGYQIPSNLVIPQITKFDFDSYALWDNWSMLIGVSADGYSIYNVVIVPIRKALPNLDRSNFTFNLTTEVDKLRNIIHGGYFRDPSGIVDQIYLPNYIGSIAPLAEHPEIQHLDLRSLPPNVDHSPLKKLVNLKTLILPGFEGSYDDLMALWNAFPDYFGNKIQ